MNGRSGGDAAPGGAPRRARATALGPLPAFAAGTVVVLAVCGALVPFGDDLPRAVPALLLVFPVVLSGILGGRLVAAAVTAEAAFVVATLFLPPIGSPAVEVTHDVVVLAIFAVVAAALGVIISTVVTSERRRVLAERAQVAALTDLDAQRSALLRSVSHDLRTPLASIRAVVTDLRAGLPFDEATRDDLLDLVASESERLDRLVANLLSMSRIEAGALLPDRHPIDVGELLEAVVEHLSFAVDHVHVQVDVEPDLPAMLADYTQLDQVVSNLVENAARHSPPGGAVRIRATRAGDMIRVSVEDEGPGIDPAEREAVFEPFHAAGSGGSTGIGLAICRSIVEAHGGTIAVDDHDRRGARITFEVPAEPGDRAGDR